MQGGEYALRALFDEHQLHGCDLTFGLPNLYSARMQQYRHRRNMSEKMSEINQK
jgi:hypothetical protein